MLKTTVLLHGSVETIKPFYQDQKNSDYLKCIFCKIIHVFTVTVSLLIKLIHLSK